MSALPLLNHSMRDADQMLERALAQWGGDEDLWIFGYGSLIWRPEFDFSERRSAHVHGWHRALKMWSTINRGTPQVPGLVFGMLSGGSCQGMAFRIPRNQGDTVMRKLWLREMPNAVYDPRWLPCRTPHGAVKALAFTLSRQSPHHTGELAPDEYRRIFSEAQGIYGTTLDYAQATFDELQRLGIDDKALKRLLAYADFQQARCSAVAAI
ncbi:gamma-glutamylcyclotransferase [Comamonas thiooxydans]|uniref:glutathione-specific gamma-glutamylcyclotransferase n=1 Tax=Comamonas thiooxydans TaxID=363952 RepID=A0AA42TW00_9BURK|nr:MULTISPECIES: gamma-glutamylcyclotransferase [Comamonas]EFI59075.1 ChaC-like protein [Comamonas thiooxydans]MDH1336630.1 gamma-glutamylcyclotransferase [Comamonas thiooxydans]MDH1473564.1 gamma-glutamylcyclotransferase [Comamonas thiooxydans]MDH1742678.1 gamma-glutamylcyclotransferase [Comamonas thiooxydans]MDH1788697.1 gamma-glutamylcyclotransferase [Comamonas thiooxydans]